MTLMVRPGSPPAGHQAAWPLAFDRTSAATARRLLVRWARDRGLSASTIEDAVLAVSELVANAIEHGAEPVELTADVDRGVLVVGVSDGDPELPERAGPSAYSVSGRGLSIVGALAADWGITRHGGGKTIWVQIQTSSGARDG